MKKRLFILGGLGLAFSAVGLAACRPVLSEYDIVWSNYDGTILEVDNKVPYGTVPTYDGETPIKEDKDQYSYTFNGWSPTVEAASKNTVYTAQYLEVVKDVVVSFDLDGGTSPSYSGATITTKNIEAKDLFFDVSKEGYKFRGWSCNDVKVFNQHGEKLADVSYNYELTFKALYAQDVEVRINMNIRGAGTVSGAGIYQYDTNVDLNAIPAEGYKFVGWYSGDVEVSQVAEYKIITDRDDLEFVAVFSVSDSTLTVKSSQPLLGSVKIIGDDEDYGKENNKDFQGNSVVTISSRKDLGNQRFLGWFNEKGELVSTNPVYTFNMPGKDYTLYAKWEAPSGVVYIVNNNEQAGTLTGAGYYANGENVHLIASPNDGYQFGGYYSDKDYTELLESSLDYQFTMGEEDKTVYAKWESGEYSITYLLNGGVNNSSNPSKYTADDEFELLPPSKEHYVFLTWTLNDQPIDKVNKGTTSNIVLEAMWSAERHTVSFDSKGGSAVNSVKVDYGTKMNMPTDPTKTGYTFEGWYKEAACTNEWNFSTDIVTSDITLYAKWVAEEYDIEITVDTVNNFGTVDVNLVHDVPFGTEYSVDNNQLTIGSTVVTATPHEDDAQYSYCFDAWYFVDSGEELTSGTITGEEEVEAHFERTVKTYTIFVGTENDYGTVSPSVIFDVPYGTQLTKYGVYDYWMNEPFLNTINANSNESDAQYWYNFNGWYIDNIYYDKGSLPDVIVISGDLSMIASFGADIRYYNVLFEMNGHGGDSFGQALEYGSVVTNPGTTDIEGYTFDGWYTDEELTELYDFATPVDSYMTLYAKWTPVSQTLAFNTQGGSEIAPVDINYDSLATPPSAPTKDGFTFTGWYKEAECVNAWDFANDVIKGDTTLYAKWSSNVYYVTFNTNGGSTVNPVGVDGGETISAPDAPTKEGYNFVGWYTDGGLTNAYNFSIPVTNSFTLYAKWNPVSYTINYELDGGTNNANNPDNYNIEDEDITLLDPTKEHYTFAGWTGAGISSPTKDVKINSGSTGNKTFTANWTAIEYPVHFNSNGGSEVDDQSIAYNTLVEKPADPSKVGYGFSGWYEDALLTYPWDFEHDVIEGETTLYAKWTINKYTVSFDTDGGSIITAINNVEHGSTIEAPSTPTKTGHTFVNWYTQKTGGSVWNYDNHEITSDTTIYARWTVDTFKIRFNANGGSGSMSDITVTYNIEHNLTSNDFSKVGYTFSGWNSEENGTGTSYANEGKVTDSQVNAIYTSVGKDGIYNLYAQWTPENYSISYDLNGGSVSSENPTQYNIETPTFTLNNPTKEGYTFGGWTGTGLVNPSTNVSVDVGSTGNRNYDASWYREVILPTVQNGTVNGAGLYTPGDEVTITATASSTNYKFVGWYDNSGYTGDPVSTSPTYVFTMPDDNLIYYAKFQASYETIEYGYYPQSRVDSTLAATLDENRSSLSTTSNGFYIYEDNYYYWANSSGSNTYYWYKCEPITWVILEKNTANNYYLVVSEKILDTYQYYDFTGHSINATGTRTVSGKTVYNNNYSYSDIRAWLNGYNGKSYSADNCLSSSFYKLAFGLDNGSRIMTMTVDNSAKTTSSNTNIYACNNTSDKVTLCSYKFFTTYGYLSNTNNRKAAITNYGARNVLAGGYYSYWLRSPAAGSSANDNQSKALFTNANGTYNNTHTTTYYYGVRPVVQITIS